MGVVWKEIVLCGSHIFRVVTRKCNFPAIILIATLFHKCEYETASYAHKIHMIGMSQQPELKFARTDFTQRKKY